MMSFETFRKPDESFVRLFQQSHPSVFDGQIRIKKYKITIEEVEESDEVLKNRIETLLSNPKCLQPSDAVVLRELLERYSFEKAK